MAQFSKASMTLPARSAIKSKWSGSGKMIKHKILKVCSSQGLVAKMFRLTASGQLRHLYNLQMVKVKGGDGKISTWLQLLYHFEWVPTKVTKTREIFMWCGELLGVNDVEMGKILGPIKN